MSGAVPGARRLLLAFVLSGFAALTYEMSWVRQLVMLFGVSYFAITTIITVFMAGIALGALVAGRLVDRWRLPPLLALAGLELFLAIYAQLFSWLHQLVDAWYLFAVVGSDLSFTTHSLLRFVFAALILLPPTLASGATLPVASKAFVRDDQRLGGALSQLYGANVVGAALGTVTTTFFVIGLWGYPATAWMGSVANLLAAALVVWVHLQTRPATTSAPARSPTWLPGAAVIGLSYFTVGFSLVGGELLWVRVTAQAGFNPVTYVFGMVLVTFLLGHALGSGLLYPWVVRRWDPRRLFWVLQAFISGFTVFAVLALTMRWDALEPMGWLRGVGVMLPWERAWILIPGVLLPAMMSGAMFPLSSRLSIRGVSRVGTGVGSLSALSTVGGIAGSFLTGFWLMPTFGTISCLLGVGVLTGLGAIWSAWALRLAPVGRRAPVIRSAVLLGVGAALVWLVPASSALILFPGETIVVFDDGRNSSTAIVDHTGGSRFMLVGGERLMGGGSDVSVALALHPQARTAAVIGVGTGSVTAEALLHRQLRSVTAIDIDGDIPKFIPYMLGERAALFQAPRFRFVENDGRHFLRTSSNRYDLIVNDAAIYAWYLELSTLEFNRLVRSRLAPDGLYVGRLHLWRITDTAFRSELRTFLEVFPNTAFWKLSEDIGMLVGCNGDLGVDGSKLQRSPSGQMARLWYTAAQLRELAQGGRLITDDHPLHVAETFMRRDLYPVIEYTAPSDLPTPPPSSAPGGPAQSGQEPGVPIVSD